jgi:hypothetical protein
MPRGRAARRAIVPPFLSLPLNRPKPPGVRGIPGVLCALSSAAAWGNTVPAWLDDPAPVQVGGWTVAGLGRGRCWLTDPAKVAASPRRPARHGLALAMPLKAEDGANDERQVGTPTLELAPCEHRNIFMQHRRGRMRNPP